MNLNIEWWWLAAAGGVLLAAGIFLWWWRRRPRDPAELERRRRAYLNQVGRIVEGHILEISDAPQAPAPSKRGAAAPTGNGAPHLVYYTYSISGVSYETAQDITGMEERACLERLVAGQHISVKFDPENPSNSILIADDWSGLH